MAISADISHLQVAFKTKKSVITAVDDIHFTLEPGKTLALLGESGCGKSLTSLALMRLLPHNAVYGMTSGIKTQDGDLLDLPESMMRQLRGRRLAIIFQEPMTALNPVLTIGTQLAEALPKQGKLLSSKALNAHLIELLTRVDMPNPNYRLQQYPHQLSGGQKQRVMIAMALANHPDILIADEPTTALDVTIQAQILALLKKLQQEEQMSILLITHDLGVVKAMADTVCVMYAGQLVEQASAAQFFTKVMHPYSQQLFASLPHFEKRHMRLQAIKGNVPTLEARPGGCSFHPRCAHVMASCNDIAPQLQTVNQHKIRCHLYPRLTHLADVTTVDSIWPTKQDNQELLLSANQLSVVFRTKQRLFSQQEPSILKAVDGLSLELYRGKTLALVGESGCGKSTVSRVLLRLQPLTSGNIIYRGQNIAHLKHKALLNFRQRVQIIFQDPYSSMNPRMTVGEIIAEGLVIQGLSNKAILQRQLELLNQVNLSKHSLHRYPHQFSGGQRQRICIARALATKPDILICDEPTSALDVSVQAQILNLLKELQIEYALSYLFITHNMSVVSWLADDILVMKAGQMIEQGPAKEILQTPKQIYTQELLASVLTV